MPLCCIVVSMGIDSISGWHDFCKVIVRVLGVFCSNVPNNCLLQQMKIPWQVPVDISRFAACLSGFDDILGCPVHQKRTFDCHCRSEEVAFGHLAKMSFYPTPIPTVRLLLPSLELRQLCHHVERCFKAYY